MSWSHIDNRTLTAIEEQLRISNKLKIVELRMKMKIHNMTFLIKDLEKLEEKING